MIEDREGRKWSAELSNGRDRFDTMIKEERKWSTKLSNERNRFDIEIKEIGEGDDMMFVFYKNKTSIDL
jgi:hypothetical protein